MNWFIAKEFHIKISGFQLATDKQKELRSVRYRTLRSSFSIRPENQILEMESQHQSAIDVMPIVPDVVVAGVEAQGEPIVQHKVELDTGGKTPVNANFLGGVRGLDRREGEETLRTGFNGHTGLAAERDIKLWHQADGSDMGRALQRVNEL